MSDGKLNTKSYGMIIPPNNLKTKVKITVVKDGSETESIDNADAAMEAMGDTFKEWLEDEVSKFDKCRKDMCANPNKEHMAALHIVAHDVKGQAQTMGFPLITLVSASLCKLIEVWENVETFPLDLLNNHVDSIKVMLAQDIKEKDHPIGKKLTDKLINTVFDFADEIEAKKKAEEQPESD
ncbi:MAG: hypothetical protein COC24_011820 [Alphaproteobacteria bacterium]|nr:hypothetical protein [Alphaproteobacteria bacterium]